MGIAEEKAALRAKMAAVRLTPEERAEASAAVCAQIEQSDFWQKARVVLLFAPLADEPDLTRLCIEGKQLCFPRTVDEGYEVGRGYGFAELDTGRFGVLEPPRSQPAVPRDLIDLVLVPGMAFDNACRRLGRGGGFYDRWLGELTGGKIGVGFEHQRIRRVPSEPHDRVLDAVVFPSGWNAQ